MKGRNTLIYFFILSYGNLEAYWRQLSLVGQSTMVTCTLLEADICRFHVELVTFYILWRMRRTEKDTVVPETDSIFGGMLHKIQRKFMINHSRHILEFTHLIKGRLQQGHCLLILLFLSLLKHSL